MKRVFQSKFEPLHFSIIFLIAFLSCDFLWFIGIPLFYFLTFGSGEVGAKIGEKPIHIFINEWLPILLIFIFCVLGIVNNNKKQKLSNAKSYLLTALIISILYVFKTPIAALIVDGFN